VRTVSDTSDDLVRDVFTPLLAAAEELDLPLLRQGSRVDLARIQHAAPLVQRADLGVRRASQRMQSVSGPLPPPVRDGVEALKDRLAELGSFTSASARTTELVPPMLGATGTRRYLIAVQNPAEARGTGGLLAAYVLLEARAGRLTLVKVGANSDLHDGTAVPVDLGPDFTGLYGADPALWSNGNLSPHFPYAARIWSALYEKQFKVRLDGVIAIDPIVMGNLLGATGSVTLKDGSRVGSDNAARTVMQTIYTEFPGDADDVPRDAYLIELGQAVIGKLLAGSPDRDPKDLVTALQTSAEESRIHIFSAHADEERTLAQTSVGGTVPDTTRPYAGLVVNNGGGNKLDYYLGRTVRYSLLSCTGDTRESLITVTLTNGAPATGLPEYVLGNKKRPASGQLPQPGYNRLLVYVFATRGATLEGAELDGKPFALHAGRERGHPVFSFSVDIAPGASRTAVLQLREPRSTAAPVVRGQALARPLRSVTKVTQCG
jgi:hypothetical protein